MTLRAPFTEDQVEAINAFQANRRNHPFTCGTEGCREVLAAHVDGMKCPKCGYVQEWVHSFMAEPQPPKI